MIEDVKLPIELAYGQTVVFSETREKTAGVSELFNFGF